MDRTTLTAALKPLERRGLLKIIVGKEDRRSRLLSLTAAGRALLAKALPVWKETHAAVDRELAPHSPDELRASLRKLA
jgi:DNA-binding MarR family transcriptional regulator